MKKNIGTLDRISRLILGLGLIGFALIAEGSVSKFGWIGIIPLMTAIIGFCPVYTLIGVKTCTHKK